MAAVRRTLTQPRGKRGPWRARYFDPRDGKWVSKMPFRTKAEAAAWVDERVAGIVTGFQPQHSKAAMTFQAYFEEHFWPAEQLARATKAGQMSSYRNHIKPMWGGVRLCDITVDAVKRWRVSLETRECRPIINMHGKFVRERGRTLKPSTQTQIYWLFRKAVASAVEDGYIGRSPMPRKSGLPKVEPNKPTRILEPDEIERFARAAKRHETLIFTLAYGGFRISEALALRVDDLDFADGFIIVDEKLTDVEGRLEFSATLKRRRSQRVVPVPPSIMEMLREHIGLDADPRALLFTDTIGGPIRATNWRRRNFDPAWRDAGLERLTPHDLRHTAASAWFDEGFDIVQVARFLGDTVQTAEAVYVHIYKGRNRDSMARMDARFARGRATDRPGPSEPADRDPSPAVA